MPNHHPPCPVRRSARLNDGAVKEEVDIDKLVDDFEEFCLSDALSIDLLKEWLKVVPVGAVLDSNSFIIHAIMNSDTGNG